MHPFEEKLVRSWPPERWQDVTVLLAVSGGADSVALLRAMAAIRKGGRGRFVVAHLNHGLRGAESDGYQTFVAELATTLGCLLEIARVDVAERGEDQSTGLEEAARNARYAFLQKAAEEHGARYVALAHTAGDQAETILHRIVRGTGIAGLAGMPRTRPLGRVATLIRPLLSHTRAEVEDYLKFLGQGHRTDTSNLERRFTRNRIRHELLPAIARDYNPAVSEALLRLGSLAGELQSIVDAQVQELLERTVTLCGQGSVSVLCRGLAARERYLIREVFIAIWRRQKWPQQAMTFAHWDELAELAETSNAERSFSRTRVFPGAVQAQEQGEQLSLTRLA